MNLTAGHFQVRFPRPALVMGILNVTPDSFSDGGRFFRTKDAIGHGFRLAEQGAEIIDVGGESSRPGAEPVSVEEERTRVIPVIQALARDLNIPISVDTQKVEVARAALLAGASIVNDIAANRQDPAMWELVAEMGAGYIAMHMQGTPRTMQQRPSYRDVVMTVEAFFEDRLERLRSAGVRREQILLDPGIGFGKTGLHNLQLIGSLSRFTRFKRPLVLGVSRKSFLGRAAGEALEARLPGALACTCWARQAGVQIFRTHDVIETRRALEMTDSIARAVERNGEVLGPATRSQSKHALEHPAK